MSSQRALESAARPAEATQEAPLADLSPHEMHQSLHALRVAQIELEMQNDELRNAQLTLQTLQARYFDLYDLAPVGYATVGITGRILDSNLKLSSLLGVERSKLTGTSLSRYVGDAHGDSLHIFCNRPRSLGGSGTMELQVVSATGSASWVHLSATAVYDEQEPQTLRSVFTDISERKANECEMGMTRVQLKALLQPKTAVAQQREAMLCSISTTVTDLVWLKDEKGVFMVCNSMFERCYEFPESQIIGKRDYDFVDHELATAFRAHDRRAMLADKPTASEDWRTFADDGHRALYETIKTSVCD